MSRRFSNLQYISIGILFGTCVFLWTRKLNLTKTFQSNGEGNLLRQVARNEDEKRLIDSWANTIEESTNFEDGDEEVVNGKEDNSNDQIRPRDSIRNAAVPDNEVFSMNSPNTSQEIENVDKKSSDEQQPITDKIQSPEPIESVSETIDTQTENTFYNEDNSSVSPAAANEMNSSISTTVNSVMILN